MSGEALSRRSALAVLAAGAVCALGGRAVAMGRTRPGGSATTSLPWALEALDPHDGLDAVAALFAGAAFDPLFAATAAGAPFPALADGLPTRDGGGAIVRLRPGLVTARGRPLDARDVAFSLERARARGAAPLLSPLGPVRTAPGDPLAVAFPRADAAQLTRALTSPLTAIVPRGFDPRAPDGTGAFAARLEGGQLSLTRNERAARGAAWLDRWTVRAAPDLRAALRAFEVGGDDVGWLGAGLFGRREGARPFDLGPVAAVALLVGESLGPHARPGGAQALCDGIPRDRLAHLGLAELADGDRPAAWTAGPVDLCVEPGAPHLREVAEAVAASLARPDHPVTVRELPRRDVVARGRRDALALVVVRPLLPTEGGFSIALAHLSDPSRSAPPPGAGPREPARRGTGTLRVGVLGVLPVAGGLARGLSLARDPGGGWDLGASHRGARAGGR